MFKMCNSVVISALVIILALVCNSHCAESAAPESNGSAKPVDICNVCKCVDDKQTMNCLGLSLNTQFRNEDWETFNASHKTIEIINLSYNKITHLLQFPLLNIKVLDLSHNSIIKIENRAFTLLPNVTELDLSFNRLTSNVLKPEIFEIKTHLRALLIHNFLKGNYAPETYKPLRYLRVLRLGNNMLHTLHQDLFEHMELLEVLSLDSNPFRVIDISTLTSLSNLHDLQHLDLSFAELENIPKSMLHTPNKLQSLNLTGNLLKELPSGLMYAKSLKWLSLDENPIKAIEDSNVFPTMPSLEILHMCYMNDLKGIGEGGFKGLINLKELYLNNNPHLSYIHRAAFSREQDDPKAEGEIWPPLEKLYLHNNNISTLDVHVLGRWDNLVTIDIRYNHWSCDCENQWIVADLIPLIEAKSPALVHGLQCHEPIEMIHKTLLEMEEQHKEMRCLDRYGNRPERDGAMLIGVLVGLITAIPICLVAVLCYKKRCGINRGPADFSRAFYQRADMADDTQHI